MSIHFLIYISDTGKLVLNRQLILTKLHAVDIEDLMILRYSNKVGAESQ
jgi:hypothetical protein